MPLYLILHDIVLATLGEGEGEGGAAMKLANQRWDNRSLPLLLRLRHRAAAEGAASVAAAAAGGAHTLAQDGMEATEGVACGETYEGWRAGAPHFSCQAFVLHAARFLNTW